MSRTKPPPLPISAMMFGPRRYIYIYVYICVCVCVYNIYVLFQLRRVSFIRSQGIPIIIALVSIVTAAVVVVVMFHCSVIATCHEAK